MPVCLPLELLKALAPVIAAALAALIAVVSWFGKSLVSWVAWLFTRRQNRIDLMTAIASEIGTNLIAEGGFAQQDEATVTFIPYFASTDAPPLLASLTDKFLLLPANVSPSIFNYFNLSQALDAQIKDFRSEAFAKIGIIRQRETYRDTILLARETVEAGREAIAVIGPGIDLEKNFKIIEPVVTALAIVGSVFVLLEQLPALIGALLSGAEEWVSSSCKPPALLVQPAPHP